MNNSVENNENTSDSVENLKIASNEPDNKKYVPRLYQLAIANSVLKNGSTLVVLPTGLGKTLIALLVMKEIFNRNKDAKVLFLAPTKALVEQHRATIGNYFSDLDNNNEIVALTGSIKKEKRLDLWEKRIVISTPQTVVSDLLSDDDNIRFPYDLVVFDEAHRAIGKYSYTKIAQIANLKNCLILALTASPGSKFERINEILNVLGIKNIEIRSYEDKDVIPYIQKKKIKWLQIELDKDYLEAIAILRNLGNSLIEQLKSYGINGNFRSKKGLKELRDKILAMKSNAKFTAISVYTVLFNVIHMQELLETQGVHALLNYYNSLKERKKSRAIVKLLSSNDIKRAIEKVQNKEHPKLSFLLDLIKKLGNKKIIVFAQYRVQVEKIVEYLKANNLKAELFLGKGKGFSQKKQKEIIERFRNNEFDVLVSTSIGEEGLDIPSVDIVIFYEPVPSEIRSIQRKGRAGRSKIGEIYILITKDTRDEYYFWSAFRKEKKMSKIIKQMKAEKVVSVNSVNVDLDSTQDIQKIRVQNQTNSIEIQKENKALAEKKQGEESEIKKDKKNEKKQTTINDFLD